MIRPAILASILIFSSALAWAHEVTYLGTVVAVESARVQVRTVDEMTKKEQTLWFLINKETRVLRGEKRVSFAEAQTMKGERIAVIVDHDAPNKMLALEIRYAAMDVAMAVMRNEPPPKTGGQAGAMPPMTMGAEHQHAGGQASMPQMHMASPWHFMQDGLVSVLFNHQGGPRGGSEGVAPNWWMGMLTKANGRHQFGLNAMLSLDPATVGKSGYREIFQVGEALDGKPLIDRQHPHDLFMQLAASWRLTFGEKTALMIAGGPVGEPTLGPVAFMHRASAAGLPLAPLGHHTFDSTHISFGVVTAALERGKWTFEGSVFNGREPDEDRWDFDFGKMDSVAGRVWFRPTEEWDVQVSTGRLREPEELEPGDARRTTVSSSWFRKHDEGFKALTFGYGVNAAHGERRHGVFGEFTVEQGANSLFGRIEFQHLEIETLLTGETPEIVPSDEPPRMLAAITVGAARRLATWRGFEGAAGAEVTFYGVPEPLKATHGTHPVSFQAFFRLRLPTRGMDRMWNMRMSQGHRMDMAMNHSGHRLP